ncbi:MULTISPECIES: fumarylacetoacetate hydrolase family protein [unclassified Chelatococcus]|uniref:fumarylacetoacetate hydrolase family protein n=1 Tax=unclassified Chelatococcus TaxID=2638111 RepID=UPI001BCFE8EA|nr:MULTISPECIES: fumarylacetoacetate hydrolase family protein [unclassified Chelatococcus]MBS7700352.1 fumarylacetoacetate hydrolase family protein [Chelatococcus sp. YT9]MBX3556148.1 fumarylacetoacetate hydrolase family protein [Chelatococcus sp.]
MRLATILRDGKARLAAYRGQDLIDLSEAGSGLPASMLAFVEGGDAARASVVAALDKAPSSALVDPEHITFLPVLPRPGKILCVGLNYADHSAESGFKQPDYPTLFGRFATTLIGHRAPMIRPNLSDQLDYEGEIAAVIGRRAKHVPKARALDYIVGYSVFNEGSVREYQFKAPQWTVGKNFDGTGAFGPALVTADELPPGATGLKLETRLNGKTVQSASTDSMVFDVASLVAIISEAITLEPGDVIVTGTPAGVGVARKPPLFMKPGDVCEVEVEGVGLLLNPIAQENDVRAAA